MPTQEERLQIVEFDLNHFKTETIKAYGDMALEMVMVKGLTEDGVKRLIVVKRTLDEHTVLLTKQNVRLDQLENTLDEHTAVLQEHTTILNEHTTILNEHTARFDRLETMLTQVLARLPEKP